MSIIESLISAEFSRAFAWTLFHSLWQGAVIALMAVGLLFILRKHRPGIRYGIMYIILLMMPVFFAGTFMMTYKPGNITNNELSGITRYQEDNFNEMPANTIIEMPRTWLSQTVQLFESQSKWLVLIWFLGFFVFLIRFSGSVFYIYRLKNHQVYQVDSAWRSNLKMLSHKIGLNKNVKLVESALARIPMTIGYLKPVILLPLGTLSGVPPQQIDAILLHELAHIMRKDYLLNIVQSLIELLFFYHPVTWWLSAKIRQEREHICDDIAIGVNHDHLNYIKALTTMEELNSKSPLLATAITGSKKKLLLRVKRLITPVKLRKGLGEGITAFVLLVGLVLTLSVNALSFIPNTFDLSGRETGEKLFNLLPFTAAKTDSVVATSKSGKVTMKVYTDTVNADDQKNIEVIVEQLDANYGEGGRVRDEHAKEVIVIKRNAGQPDSQGKVIIKKSGDSIQIVKSDTMFWLPANYDTTIVTEGGFVFSGYGDYDLPEIPEMKTGVYHFNEDNMKWSHEQEKAMREIEIEMQDLERKHQMMRVGPDGDVRVMVAPPEAPMNFHWAEMPPPQPPVSNAEKIIRQELKDDGLTMRGKNYVIEIDTKSMYINGEKQPKEIFRKYLKLVESLENAQLAETGTYKLIF